LYIYRWFWHFSFDFTEWFCQYQLTDSDINWKISVSVTSNTLWLIKTMMLVLKVSTYVNTSITAPPIGLTVMQVIMSVSTFKTDIILFVVGFCLHNVAWKCLTKSKSICIFWNLRVIITYIWILIDIGFGNCCQATRACCCCC
jgi:hypothetical protein